MCNKNLQIVKKKPQLLFTLPLNFQDSVVDETVKFNARVTGVPSLSLSPAHSSH